MLKQITALSILLAFVVQTFSGPFILLDYYANPAAFAKNCINKAKPTMHCNGKCQAMKKMQQEEKKDQQNTSHKTGNKITVLALNSSYCTSPLYPGIILKQNNFHHISRDAQDRSLAFFHPPRS